MMRSTSSRRSLLLVPAAGVFVAMLNWAVGSEKKGPGNGEAGKGAVKKVETALLTVAVMGNGNPIARAEVRITFPPSVGGESTLPTGLTGEVTFKSVGLGTAKVRVIATGWTSELREVVLKEGSQRLTIDLKPLAVSK